ncbi:coiled coil domain-containing protein [Arcobacter sp. CECT 8983]|uniref:coiled coil domain-containing protein n=1 Tax=Arcobacter sp. CECT 8983 TaxID=2044508 RepID=UPI00100B486E|nr:coiled coil domain-containing protein [Arcobacter sp. CECT 8983]RXJ90560.1 coiled coil domain-containing protein [Arcobacter sp. CECT 8983]
MGMKKEYERKLQAQLDEWSAEIDKLKAKAEGEKADKKIEYYEQIDTLKSMQANAEVKLSELKNASDNAWEDLKAGVDSAWESLGEALDSAKSRF